ncbi:MAG: adenylosuccinate lyase [Alphaproteobacteria bacterium]|nr:adenylosuccinate lyase [Alphaproteobacteria bacterium]
MIPRYSRPQMVAIWEPENRYNLWLDIEAHACDAQAKYGYIPKEAAEAFRQKAKFDVKRIDEIEQQTKHDVIAFLTNVAEYVGEPSRYVHQGMTSSDVLDTCLALQLVQACDILLNDLDILLDALKRRAFEHQYTLCIGRSHGIHAEPVSFGLKLASHWAIFYRNKKRLFQARQEIGTCAISGAVGTFAHIDPRIETYVAEKLNLMVEPISTQIIPRDRHAMFFSVLGVIASSIENLATEIRHLQRSEVGEVEEYFSIGQKGSSAMPHKRNPVLCENVTGLARTVRAAVIPFLENITLWHERDISHSSVERILAPDTTVTLDFTLARLANIIDKLIVYPDKMRANLDKQKGLIYSQRVLLALTQKGMSREESYALVQKYAMQSWHTENNFLQILKEDTQIKKFLQFDELAELFDPIYHLKHVDLIFNRVFNT